MFSHPLSTLPIGVIATHFLSPLVNLTKGMKEHHAEFFVIVSEKLPRVDDKISTTI